MCIFIHTEQLSFIEPYCARQCDYISINTLSIIYLSNLPLQELRCKELLLISAIKQLKHNEHLASIILFNPHIGSMS